MKREELPLVRGGELPKQALDWIKRVAKFFPGTERDLIQVRIKPISPSPRGGEIGNSTQRKKDCDHDTTSDQKRRRYRVPQRTRRSGG